MPPNQSCARLPPIISTSIGPANPLSRAATADRSHVVPRRPEDVEGRSIGELEVRPDGIDTRRHSRSASSGGERCKEIDGAKHHASPPTDGLPAERDIGAADFDLRARAVDLVPPRGARRGGQTPIERDEAIRACLGRQNPTVVTPAALDAYRSCCS